MDKGLDIAVRRCLLAFHAGAADSPRKLTRFAAVLERCVRRKLPPVAGERALRDAALEMGCALHCDAADRALQWAAAANRHILTPFDSAYPRLLAEIAHPPLVLFVDGDPATLDRAQIAIVGSRKATHYGRNAAFRIAHGLARSGAVITSGMALGIDGAAHEGALAADRPTVAVLGCGIDRVYPGAHRKLSASIAIHGALVSEFPLGAPPRPYHFPRRNRIISGLSLGTLVVEAALRSGSITTALHALEQSRDVYALPGSVRNPLAAGCHALIQQGALLVNDHEDIVQQYPGVFSLAATVPEVPREAAKAPAVGANGREREVLRACAHDPASFDEIVHRTGLTATEVSSILSALEVRGAVRSLAGNTYLGTID